MSSKTLFFSSITCWIGLLCLLPGEASAGTLTAGDVAPLGSPDQSLDVGDVLVLGRIVFGELVPTTYQQVVGDVAPLGAPDGLLNVADVLILQRALLGTVVLPPIETSSVNLQVSSGSDDVEESPLGNLNSSSLDLDLVSGFEGVKTVGVRFNNVDVPQGTPVLSASIQFTSAGIQNNDVAVISIVGEAHDDAQPISGPFAVSTRALTASSVIWSPPAWLVPGLTGTDQQTADLASVVQNIVDRPGWVSGNSMMFIFTGSGQREAKTFDAVPSEAPQLLIEYAGSPVNQAPIVDAGLDDSLVLPANTVLLNGSVTDDGEPSGMVSTVWNHVGGGGAGTVTFDDATLLNATATVTSDPGTYVLRFTADDSELVSFDEVTVTVEPVGAVSSLSQVAHFLTGYTAGGVQLTIPSIDPAGLVWHSPTGHLFISDPEINEVLPVWDTVMANVFEVSLDGATLHAQYDLTQNPGNQSLRNKEPTGITYCSHDSHFYMTNDDLDRVYRVSWDGTSFLTTDVVLTIAVGTDPEGITCDPVAQKVYVVDGGIKVLVYSYSGGFVLDQVLDLVVTAGSPDGIPSDPEGIVFDPVSGTLFMVSDPDNAIFQYTTDGVYIKKFDINGFVPPPISPQGLTIGPASGSPTEQSIYISDAGIDNDIDSNERDGVIYEALIQRAP